jgi:molybdate transport system substrate-binding protein
MLLPLLAQAACGGADDDDASGGETVTLSVAAAADLQSAFTEIGTAFTEQTGHNVEFNFGSSGQLAAQIERGAPFDVFAAANVALIDGLIASGDIIAESKHRYAVGRIVIVSNKEAGVQATTLDDLTNDQIQWIAIANPEHAPYGVAARDALQRAGLWDALQGRMVLGDNVRHTLQLVQLGEAEVGIVALAIASVPEVTAALIDASMHDPIVQAIGITAASEHPDAARAFVDFVMSADGQAILERFGFERPAP